MKRFRCLSAPAVALLLVVFLLAGGGIAAHSHDGLKREELRSAALSGGLDLPDTAAHVQSSVSLDVEPCPACCAAGRRLGALDASQPTLRSPLTMTQAVRAADDLGVSSFKALRPAPRGPPSV